MGEESGLTKLHNNLSKVIRVSRVGKEAFVTDISPVVRLPEPVLLHIAHALHDEPNRPQHDAGDIPPGAEAVLPIPRDAGAVDESHGQGDGPDPEHLEDPEAEEGEEPVALVVEAVVPAGPEDAEEEEAREAEGPGDEEEGGDELAGVVVAAEGEGEDGEEGKVGPSGKVCKVSAAVHFEENDGGGVYL